MPSFSCFEVWMPRFSFSAKRERERERERELNKIRHRLNALNVSLVTSQSVDHPHWLDGFCPSTMIWSLKTVIQLIHILRWRLLHKVPSEWYSFNILNTSTSRNGSVPIGCVGHVPQPVSLGMPAESCVPEQTDPTMKALNSSFLIAVKSQQLKFEG